MLMPATVLIRAKLDTIKAVRIYVSLVTAVVIIVVANLHISARSALDHSNFSPISMIPHSVNACQVAIAVLQYRIRQLHISCVLNATAAVSNASCQMIMHNV